MFFQVAATVSWLEVRPERAFSLGPNDLVPVWVHVRRSSIPKASVQARVVVSSTQAPYDSAAAVYLDTGSSDEVFVRDYFPLRKGATWRYSPSGLKGSPGEPWSELQIQRVFYRGGIRVAEATYRIAGEAKVAVVYIALISEIPVVVRSNTRAIQSLPNTERFWDLAFDDVVPSWLFTGVYEPGVDQLNSNTTRYSTAPLNDLTPIHVESGDLGPYESGAFGVDGDTPCLATHTPTGPPWSDVRYYVDLLGRGIGPLLDPFGNGALIFFDPGETP